MRFACFQFDKEGQRVFFDKIELAFTKINSGNKIENMFFILQRYGQTQYNATATLWMVDLNEWMVKYEW